MDEILVSGVISRSKSEWASPVVLIPKTDGSLRFCVDYQRLNALTVRDTYPIPRMDECLDTLGEAKVFPTLDCNSRYWQITVAGEDRPKTTSTCHSGTYQFNRMPFGLVNAPATFQSILDILLSGYSWKSCLIYLDDIIIFSKDYDTHLKDVDVILRALQQKGLSLKLNKCTFSRLCRVPGPHHPTRRTRSSPEECQSAFRGDSPTDPDRAALVLGNV